MQGSALQIPGNILRQHRTASPFEQAFIENITQLWESIWYHSIPGLRRNIKNWKAVNAELLILEKGKVGKKNSTFGVKKYKIITVKTSSFNLLRLRTGERISFLSSGFLLLSAGAAPAPQVLVLCPSGDKANAVSSSPVTPVSLMCRDRAGSSWDTHPVQKELLGWS